MLYRPVVVTVKASVRRATIEVRDTGYSHTSRRDIISCCAFGRQRRNHGTPKGESRTTVNTRGGGSGGAARRPVGTHGWGRIPPPGDAYATYPFDRSRATMTEAAAVVVGLDGLTSDGICTILRHFPVFSLPAVAVFTSSL